jgi:hypothetical protein
VRAVVLIALVGCGRVSFDPRHDGGGGSAIDDGQTLDQGTVDATIDPDLLFHVSFDGGLADDARGHVVTCNGSCQSVTGRVGANAVMLDGNSCMELLDDVDLRPARDTIAVWANLPVPASNADLVARPLDGDLTSNNTFEMWVQPDSGVVIAANGVQTLATGMNVAAWHHYVGVYDGSALVSYIDGGLAGADSSAGMSTYGLDSFRIGCDHDNGVDVARMTGMLDDVRFYGRALTAAEITALANL